MYKVNDIFEKDVVDGEIFLKELEVAQYGPAVPSTSRVEQWTDGRELAYDVFPMPAGMVRHDVPLRPCFHGQPLVTRGSHTLS